MKEDEPRDKRLTVRVTSTLYDLLEPWRSAKSVSDIVNALLWAYTREVDHHGDLDAEAAQRAAEAALDALEDRGTDGADGGDPEVFEE